MDSKELKARAKQLADAGVEIYGAGIAHKRATLTWERWLARNTDSVRVFDGRDELTALRERIRTLEAGIEREAAYCEKWQGEAILAGDLDRAERHAQRAARLRALLQ